MDVADLRASVAIDLRDSLRHERESAFRSVDYSVSREAAFRRQSSASLRRASEARTGGLLPMEGQRCFAARAATASFTRFRAALSARVDTGLSDGAQATNVVTSPSSP